MGIILIIIGIGAVVMAGMLILMWYLFILGFSILVMLAIGIYWLVATWAESYTNNPDTAMWVGVAVTAVILLGLGYLASRNQTIKNKIKRG